MNNTLIAIRMVGICLLISILWAIFVYYAIVKPKSKKESSLSTWLGEKKMKVETKRIVAGLIGRIVWFVCGFIASAFWTVANFCS